MKDTKKECEVKEIEMDNLSISDEIAILYRGDMNNKFFVSGILDIEDFMKVETLLLRISSSLYGFICASFHEKKDVESLLMLQIKSAMLELNELIKSMHNGKVKFERDKTNAH